MTFPIEHNASGLRVISTNDGSILITGSLDRNDGFFGEFKLNSAPFPSSISPGTNVERSKFVALYDEEGKVKWIKDLYDEFNIKEPLVHLQKDGTSKIVHKLTKSEPFLIVFRRLEGLGGATSENVYFKEKVGVVSILDFHEFLPWMFFIQSLIEHIVFDSIRHSISFQFCFANHPKYIL